MRHGQALELKQIAKARGYQQSDAGPLALDQRVRRDRAAVRMDHPVPRRTLELQGRLDLINAIQDAGTRTRGDAWHLEAMQFAGLGNQCQVREGSADIGAENVG